MKAAIILGTRPEIIKLSPVIRACQKQNVDFFILHSGQHYSANMDKIFFQELDLPQPKYNLHVGKLPYRKRVGECMREMTAIFEKEWPDVIIVQGDTFTVMMGALAAKKLDRPVMHLEAGLRSHDLTMPEEKNRILADHIGEMLYPPTKDAARNLEEEGLLDLPIFGNTVVDAVKQNQKISDKKSKILKKLGIKSKEFFLITAHRQENVDDKYRLEGILQGLDLVAKEYSDKKLIFARHPRTKKMMEEFDLKESKQITFIEPPGYLDIIQLIKHSVATITDSGGIQEESTVMEVPCITIRDNTERPESIEAGLNVLAGTRPKDILEAVKNQLSKKMKWVDLYGDGTAAQKVIKDLKIRVAERKSMKARIAWIMRMIRRKTG